MATGARAVGVVSDGGGEGSCEANYSKEVSSAKSNYKVVSKLKKTTTKKNKQKKTSIVDRLC